jgi:hypothetical protein
MQLLGQFWILVHFLIFLFIKCYMCAAMIIPTIDLKRCVNVFLRLKQGRMEDDTVFSIDDPVAMAARFG